MDKQDEFLKKFELEESFSEFTGWEAVGFHRPLAAELWELIFELINEIFAIFVVVYLFPLLYPFPEILGYRGLANGLFIVIYTIFDMGTNFGLGRFISEYRIKDPAKMMEYVNFFIRYQMITGLIQVTALSYYLFEILIHGNYGYLVWILLLEMQKQYPGMLGIFKSVLSGIQHYSAVKAMDWAQNKGFEMIINIGFILWGRAYGLSHPEIGVIMGIAIFGTIGIYIDDIILMFISAWYLNKVLKKNMGFSLIQALNFKIGKDVKQNAIKYGIPGSIIPIISSSVNTYILIVYSSNIPGYITWFALVSVGSNFVGLINQFAGFGLGTNVAEAVMNDKMNLAEFYVSYELKWRYFFRFLIGTTILACIPFFILMIENTPDLSWWMPGMYFLIPAFIKRMFEPLFECVDPIMWGAKKINQYNIIRFIEEMLKLLFVYLFIFVWEIQNRWGRISIVILIVYQNYIPYLIKTLLCYLYIKKNIMRIRIYWISTILIPIIASLPILLFAQIWLETAMPIMIESLGFNISAALSIPVLYIALFLTYFPLTIILGGFDDYQLFTFQEAVKISGPSKVIMVPLLKFIKMLANIARKIGTHGKFPIPYKEAHKEIIELMELKKLTKKINQI